MIGCPDASDRRDDRAGGDRPQAGHRLLDDVADRLHDHGRLDRRLHGGPLPPDDACLLQGAAVHGRGLADLGDGRCPVARSHVGFRRALPFTFGCFIVGGLALSGVPPFSGYFSKDSILLFAAGRGGWHWALWGGRLRGRSSDRALHVPDDLPRLPRRAMRRGARADRDRAPPPSRGADQPRERRDRGHRRRLPGPRPRGRRARRSDARGDGDPGAACDRRRDRPIPTSPPGSTTSSRRHSPTRRSSATPRTACSRSG